MFGVIYLKLEICVLSRVCVNNIKNKQTKPSNIKKRFYDVTRCPSFEEITSF